MNKNKSSLILQNFTDRKYVSIQRPNTASNKSINKTLNNNNNKQRHLK